MLQNHFTSSEGTIQGYVKEVDRLTQQLSVQEEACAQHAAETCRYKVELAELNKKLERQGTIAKADKVRFSAF